MFNPVQAHFDIADRLGSCAELTGVAVVTELPRTLTPGGILGNPIEQALAVITGGGAAILVLMPELTGGTTDKPLFFDRAEFEVVVFTCDPLTSAPGGVAARAAQLAIRIAQALHDTQAPPSWYKLAVTALQPFRLESLPAEIAKLLRDQGFHAWVVKFGTPMELPIPSQVAAPTMTEHAGTVTLACTTTGAAIYYTTDGSYPGSGSTTATLYSVPFILTTACTLRSAAQKDGWQASNLVEANYTP